MGFAAQTTNFGHSTLRPPCFWLCGSCTQFYLYSSSSRFFCRREDKGTQNAKCLTSSKNGNTYVVELNQRFSYGTLPQREIQIQYRQRDNLFYPRLSNSCNYQVLDEEQDYAFVKGDTAEEWTRAAEFLKMKKTFSADSGKYATEFTEVDSDENITSQRGNVEGQGVGKIQYPQRNNFHPQFSNSLNYRVLDEEQGYVHVQGAAEEWNKAAEEYKKEKTLHVEAGGNAKECAEMDITKKKKSPRGKIGVGQERRRPSVHAKMKNGMLPQSNAMDIMIAPVSPSIPKGRPEYEENQNYVISEDTVCEVEETRKFNKRAVSRDRIIVPLNEEVTSSADTELHQNMRRIYDKVLVVDSIPAAKKVVNLLTNQFKNLIHACDTEVADIEVKEETPVDHGKVICFSIYSGPDADYGEGKSCIWVDVLDGGGKEILMEFAPFFEDETIKKVWHNYSFDSHVIENYGIRLSGFYADTMHMARLWNSARQIDGGYSLEALSSDSSIMSDAKKGHDIDLVGKVSMKTIFGKKKVKKDGSFGKLVTIPPVAELQRDEKKLWICYSAIDSISTLKLYEGLEKKLRLNPWTVDGIYRGCMFRFYLDYFRPFGKLLVKMEREGMLVDRAYLAEIEKVAIVEQQVATERFRKWASKYCPDAKYMNIGSDIQLRQFFFGGVQNRKDHNEFLPMEKEFRVPNVDNIIEEGKKSPSKFLKITLRKPDYLKISTDKYTPSGWPSVSGDVLKSLAGEVSTDFDFGGDNDGEHSSENVDQTFESNHSCTHPDTDTSAYGAAYTAFGSGQEGIEACHAIAALCQVCSIDSLISNFILPLQGNHISAKDGRIHCSLNINTETGRLSARRPNLQNQPALEKDRYKIRQAFIAAPGNSLIVADYGQLELRILAHLANCKSMLDAFKAGGDFHSRTAMNMYPHIRDAVKRKKVLLEWHPRPGEDKPPVPLLKDAFASERRKAKMLNFSIAYGKTVIGLARDWKVSREEAQETVDRWYRDRQEVLVWQQERKKEARQCGLVYTLLGRARHFPSLKNAISSHRNHIERAAINAPVQGSAADVAMCAMLEISKNGRLQELGWRLILQIHDEVILEGPGESAEEARSIVVNCMSKPFNGENILKVDLSVDAKCALNWYSAK